MNHRTWPYAAGTILVTALLQLCLEPSAAAEGTLLRASVREPRGPVLSSSALSEHRARGDEVTMGLVREPSALRNAEPTLRTHLHKRTGKRLSGVRIINRRTVQYQRQFNSVAEALNLWWALAHLPLDEFPADHIEARRRQLPAIYESLQRVLQGPDSPAKLLLQHVTLSAPTHSDPVPAIGFREPGNRASMILLSRLAQDWSHFLTHDFADEERLALAKVDRSALPPLFRFLAWTANAEDTEILKVLFGRSVPVESKYREVDLGRLMSGGLHRRRDGAIINRGESIPGAVVNELVHATLDRWYGYHDGKPYRFKPLMKISLPPEELSDRGLLNHRVNEFMSDTGSLLRHPRSEIARIVRNGAHLGKRNEGYLYTEEFMRRLLAPEVIDQIAGADSWDAARAAAANLSETEVSQVQEAYLSQARAFLTELERLRPRAATWEPARPRFPARDDR